MQHWSAIIANLKESCQLLSAGMLIVTVFWLIKEINVITKLTRTVPQRIAQATQTINYKTTIGSIVTNLTGIKEKKRRSHRNGKKEYLRKWQEQ